jgi:hypothetical protein
MRRFGVFLSIFSPPLRLRVAACRETAAMRRYPERQSLRTGWDLIRTTALRRSRISKRDGRKLK